MPGNPNKLSQFWQELKRRRVIHVIIVYATAAFVIIELINNVTEPLSLPEWTPTLIIIILLVGFPLAIIFSWIFDVTPEGIEKTEPLKEDQRGKEVKVSATWRIATYVSIVIIIGLLVINLIGIRGTEEISEIPENTILVLPFENYSPNPDQDYFCDGMTEEVRTDLSKIHDMLVISRNTAMSFKGTKKTTKDIAREAGVRYVLGGSVRKDSNNIRIAAQLIDAESDTHLWAENYTGTLDDIFDIQVKVSRSIADALRIELSAEESVSLSEQPINNLEVYEYYLKARQEIYRFTEDGLDRAIQYLERGLQIGGENPLLYSAMGNAYFQYWNLGIRLDDAYLVKARDCAKRIFKLEPNSFHGRMILGMLQFFNNPKGAIREFEFVLRNDPSNKDAILWLCIVYLHLGLNDKADPLAKQIVRKDPLNPIMKIYPGLRLYYDGELELACESLEKTYQSDMNDPIVLWHYGRILASCGLTDQAVSILNQCTEKGRSGITRFSKLFSLALQGKNQDVVMSIGPDLIRWAKKDWMVSLWLAECLSLIGEGEMAIEYLEQAVNLGCINYPFLMKYDVFLTSIRTEERFKTLMEKVNMEWQNI